MGLSFGAFSQTELLDSIEQVQIKKIPESAQSICTSAYWNNDFDSGLKTFKLISQWNDIFKLKLNKEQKNDNKAVLILDLYNRGVPVGLMYLFLNMESDRWLIDGLNQTESLIDPFLEGYYSGHFFPLSLPEDEAFSEFGNRIISFWEDEEGLLRFLEENTVPGSNFDFTWIIVSILNSEQPVVKTTGYEERTNKGYICFELKQSFETIFVNLLTIYIAKDESGKFKILRREIAKPNADGFISK